MNSLRDYQYLIAVAETLHFGKAAESCHVSQPTLSGQLKKMEVMLGFALFERTNRHVQITRKGQQMVDAAQKIVDSQQSFQQQAKLLASPLMGEIHLGLIPTLAPYLLPHIMPSLNSELTEMTFFLYEQQTEVLLSLLSKGKLDALILPWLPEMEDLMCIDLFDEPLVLALPTEHPFVKKTQLGLSDLKGQQVLTLQDGHCLRDQTLGFCFSAGAQEDNSFSATSLETLRYMIGAGAGITLMPELATINRNDNDIVYRYFSQSQPFRKIALVTRKTFSENLNLEKISTIIQKLKIQNTH